MTDPGYLERLVEAFTELLRRERRTDLDFAEITRRIRVVLGREVPSQTVGRWMKGRVQPRESAERKAFAEVLGVSVGWLFYNEGGAQQVFVPPPNLTQHRELPNPDATPDGAEDRPRRGRAGGER